MRIGNWEFDLRKVAIAAGCGVLATLLVVYLVRPIGLVHGPAMLLYKYPLIWKLPLVTWITITAVGLLPYVLFRRKQTRSEIRVLKKEKRAARRKHRERWGPRQLLGYDYHRPFRFENSDRLWALTKWYRLPSIIASIAAVLALIFAMCTVGMFTGRAIYEHYTFTEIGQLPANGKARILPQDVAEQVATSGYNSPTSRLGQAHIVLDADGHIAWTFGEVPSGSWRRYTAKTQGVATLNAESTARELTLNKRDFEVSTNVRWTDNLKWKAYKKHFFTDVAETVYVVTASGEPVIIAPYLKYVGFWVKVPELAGVYVVHPDGTMEDLSPEEAEKRPFIVQSGRMFPEELARRIQESYQFKEGILNRQFTHRNQTQIAHTGSNGQPYLMDFGAEGTKWVSTAQPYGKAQATNAIFLTDTITGETEIWHVPQDQAYTGNSKALDIVRALSMPGITFAASGAEDAAGKFEAVEPRPIIIGGRLRFMVSVIPNSETTVTKTVIVDAKTNKAVAVFNHDTDPTADRKLKEYLHRGTLPSTRSEWSAPLGESLPSAPGVPGSDGRLSEEELQAVIDRLQESNRTQREAIRALRSGLGS